MSSVRKTVTVDASREVAFRVFTERMATWWPASHHIGKSELKDIILEPRTGGRWAERGTDGSECEWGKVLVWEPPARVVLGWQLNADFAYDATFSTDVEVRFVAETPTRTRVELEHKNLERFGAREPEVRAAFDSEEGWLQGLRRFAAKVAAASDDHATKPMRV